MRVYIIKHLAYQWNGWEHWVVGLGARFRSPFGVILFIGPLSVGWFSNRLFVGCETTYTKEA